MCYVLKLSVRARAITVGVNVKLRAFCIDGQQLMLVTKDALRSTIDLSIATIDP